MDDFLAALTLPFFSLVDLILDWPRRRVEDSWSSVNPHSRGEAVSSDDAGKRGRAHAYGPGMDPLAG
jgi:hypothetical protein